ncbi:hypothetical protein [Verminephrobacter aporrectodeae]|uniref:hypothetical protein n=1 Tax=Verminephrobacter aporrectodeae TaxID=1110389 RepID=UPI002244C04C|nr:hypothetical protein [Verminephrobacter aporrectodeae]MCW8174002.1 hypothetical protein [Verminephrobacter aporrectodeae subsp. tuberculatae]MCW8201713.1 hypothetical protein [Verminephrobacter aporrectodeae subsp. tuberculatae]
MKPSPSPLILATLCAAALTACGGSGGGSDASTDTGASPTAPGDFRVAEYVGTWTGDTTICKAGFPYSSKDKAYSYRMTSLMLAEKTVEVTYTAYTDAACMSKAGRLIEKYDASWSAGSAPGKTNVARVSLAFTGSNTGADGGSGLALNMMPDGKFISSTGKLLLDVDGTNLYGPAADTKMDADGFPMTLNTTSFATKQ